jgi:hypothetical protein
MYVIFERDCEKKSAQYETCQKRGKIELLSREEKCEKKN